MKKDILGDVATVLGAICLILIVVTILVGIFARALFNYPLSWGVELTTILVIWAVYSVFGVNYRDNTHLSINVLADILPGSVQKGLEVLTVAFLLEQHVVPRQQDRIKRIPSQASLVHSWGEEPVTSDSYEAGQSLILGLHNGLQGAVLTHGGIPVVWVDQVMQLKEVHMIDR